MKHANLKSVLVIPDLQIPYEDKRSLNAVEKLMADHEWDEIVQIGDFVDLDCISSHNKNNLRAVSNKSLFKDYDYANSILDRWQRLTKAKITIIEGNHEYRIERYIDANPQLEGLVEVPVGLKLKTRSINWIPYWSSGELYKIGKACFIHGQYTNEHHAKKTVSRFGDNVFYGHTHDVMCFSQVLRGKDKTIVGQSLGCLCDYSQSYLQGRPTNWQQAIAVFHFFPDGYFQYNVIRIFKHRFYYGGKIYEG